MSWLASAHKATRRFVSCQQYRLHGGSNSGCGDHAWKPPSSFCTSTIVNSADYRWKKSKVAVDITSTETIKPASPTPHHLRTYKLSIIDQLYVDCYTPLTLFIPNMNIASSTEIVKSLKKSLSEILSCFYPLAGEVKDNFHIECSDKGVIFTEARVKQSLKEFLRNPEDEEVRALIPKSPRTGEPSIGNYIVGVQVNIFNCGGIGLSTSITHKLFDGHTYFLFMKAWAAAARGSPEKIVPSFIASEIFPSNPYISFSWPSKFMAHESVCTKRFVFDASAIATLKDQAVQTKKGPTRMEATTALIWKAAAKASSALRPFGPQSPHALLSYVNLRARASTPLPYESIGNIIRVATGICYPESQLELSKLMGEIRESISKINADSIESIKGEKGHGASNGIIRSLIDLISTTDEGDRCLFVTSLLNSGIHHINFGWGTPIWFCDMNAGFRRIVALNDTLKGGGVEATVTLSSDEMEIFERDPELLSYATANTSPLENV